MAKDTYIPRDEVVDMNKEFDKVRKKAEKELLALPGVVAVGVGLKEIKGEMQRELCFKVKVKSKKPKSKIKAKDRIPDTIYGFKTDVNETKFGEICADSSKYRPLIGGIQIGVSTDSGLGTLGCFGKRNADGKIILLSNWHVIVGDGTNIDGDRVGQPSHNKCCSCCACGEIADVVDGRLSPNTADNMDAAIALLQGQETDTIPETRYINEIKDIGILAGSALPKPGETIWKRGRTTGLTKGQITDDNDSLTVPYESYGNISITYNTWQITPEDPPHANYVDRGDSGSISVNEHNQVVLLNFAKDGTGKGYAFNIKNIESKLNFTVLDSTFHANEAAFKGVPLSSVAPSIRNIASLSDALEYLEVELGQFAESKRLLESFKTHRTELLHLVNNNREVMAAWHRYQGPSYLAHIARSVRRDNKPVPELINGVTMQNLILKMTAVLQRNGSPELVNAVTDNYLQIMDMLSSGNSPDDWKRYLSQNDQLITH